MCNTNKWLPDAKANHPPLNTHEIDIQFANEVNPLNNIDSPAINSVEKPVNPLCSLLPLLRRLSGSCSLWRKYTFHRSNLDFQRDTSVPNVNRLISLMALYVQLSYVTGARMLINTTVCRSPTATVQITLLVMVCPWIEGP